MFIQGLLIRYVLGLSWFLGKGLCDTTTTQEVTLQEVLVSYLGSVAVWVSCDCPSCLG